MAQRLIGSRVASAVTANNIALFTATELQSVSELSPLEVIIRNTHASSRLDFGASDVAALAGYGVLALATLSFRIRSPQAIPYVIANTTAISVEVSWSGPFSGT